MLFYWRGIYGDVFCLLNEISSFFIRLWCYSHFKIHLLLFVVIDNLKAHFTQKEILQSFTWRKVLDLDQKGLLCISQASVLKVKRKTNTTSFIVLYIFHISPVRNNFSLMCLLFTNTVDALNLIQCFLKKPNCIFCCFPPIQFVTRHFNKAFLR